MVEAVVLAICLAGTSPACGTATEQWWQQFPPRAQIEETGRRIEHKHPALPFIASAVTIAYKKEGTIILSKHFQLVGNRDGARLVFSCNLPF